MNQVASDSTASTVAGVQLETPSKPKVRKRVQEGGGVGAKHSAKAEGGVGGSDKVQASAAAAAGGGGGSLSDCEVDTNILSMNRQV